MDPGAAAAAAAVGAGDDADGGDVDGGGDAHSFCPGTEKYCKAVSAQSILRSSPPTGRGY